ncbi:helix-turn-helix domain-containing protein [Idiomarina sp. 29L]|uniref:helix-turn-helix domain-containing protein n=1 Tax=Idiomarina sp. 29L TaxID=2508877 RepID=UPI0010123FDE|nr:helix-turn-helix domain-containing protein [Idiomarina sp. 29L]RXS41648.1 helix-turn-helix domain-containing protein [Idiomarina sp. 29L]
MKITSPHALAAHLKDERKRQNLSQTKVAEFVGLRQGTVSSFELSPEKSQIDTLFRLLSALGLELSIKSKENAQENNTEHSWNEEW